MKVLHCPTDTGGNPWYLSRAERELGVESDMMVFKSQRFDYPTDINLHLESVPKWFIPFSAYKILSFFKYAVKNYDVFHFNFGRSVIDYPYFYFFNYLDFELLKKLGKKIIVTYQGCDARIRSYCIENFEISACANCESKYCKGIFEKMKKKRIEKVQKYADNIYSVNPDILYNLPDFAEFMPYANFDPKLYPQKSQKQDDDTIKILHAPSNRAIKGTDYVLKTYERLKKENYKVELVLIENLPNDKAINLYQKADIVVDQLLAGWYGGFAVEAMALEKPVLCYLREKDLEFVPFKDKIPIINTTSETLYENLVNLIEDEKLRKEIGKKSRAYVEEIHDPIKIAKKLIKEAYQ